MAMSHTHMVLIDLARRSSAVAEDAQSGLHSLQMSPARLPCAIAGADLARLRAFVAGESADCDVELAFRFQDLDDLGMPAIERADNLAGLFDTSGASLLQIPDSMRITVEETYATGGGVSLGRPGRHLLCACFHGEQPSA